MLTLPKYHLETLKRNIKHSPTSFKCQAIYNCISTNRAEVRQEGTLSHKLWAPVSWLLLLIRTAGLREVSRRKLPVMINYHQNMILTYESWLWVPVVISVAEMLCFATDAAVAIRALCLFLASPGVWWFVSVGGMAGSCAALRNRVLTKPWCLQQEQAWPKKRQHCQGVCALPAFNSNSAACFQNHFCACFLYYF